MAAFLSDPGATPITRLKARAMRPPTCSPGRGEPEAKRAEEAVRATAADLTILRSTWFMQNFSEDYMLEHVLSGEIRLPAGDVPTPFLGVDDLADIAVAALTDDRHIGELYELTGPDSLTFAEAASGIAEATGREVGYTPSRSSSTRPSSPSTAYGGGSDASRGASPTTPARSPRAGSGTARPTGT